MKKLIYLLLMLTLVFSCSKQRTPELARYEIVIEHLKEHYKESEYTYLYSDSIKMVYGFVKGANQDTKDANFYTPAYLNGIYYYYNEKGDKVNGYVFEVHDVNYKDTIFGLEDYIKVIILSKDNEIVWCGSDYPNKDCTGECIKKITNLDKCYFEEEIIPVSDDTLAVDEI